MSKFETRFSRFKILFQYHTIYIKRQTTDKDIEEMAKGQKRPERTIPWEIKLHTHTRTKIIQRIHVYNKTNNHKTNKSFYPSAYS